MHRAVSEACHSLVELARAQMRAQSRRDDISKKKEERALAAEWQQASRAVFAAHCAAGHESFTAELVQPALEELGLSPYSDAAAPAGAAPHGRAPGPDTVAACA